MGSDGDRAFKGLGCYLNYTARCKLIGPFTRFLVSVICLKGSCFLLYRQPCPDENHLWVSFLRCMNLTARLDTWGLLSSASGNKEMIFMSLDRTVLYFILLLSYCWLTYQKQQSKVSSCKIIVLMPEYTPRSFNIYTVTLKFIITETLVNLHGPPLLQNREWGRWAKLKDPSL